MTSKEFECAAKNVVRDMLKRREIAADIDGLNLVWYSYLLGDYKCMIYGECMGNLYAEVTYSLYSQTLFADLYQKLEHKEMHDWDLE